jgi:hypothetical protein
MNPKLVRALPMLLGLLAGSFVIIADEKKHGGIRFLGDLGNPKSLGLLFTVAGVLCFKFFLESSGLIGLASREMISSGMPLVVAVAALPALAGLVTGVQIGFTGTSFPLIVGLMGVEGSGLTPAATLALAYAFGLMGMMFSPVHLCLLTTKEYFSASARGILKIVAPCGAVILAFGILAHIVYRMAGW